MSENLCYTDAYLRSVEATVVAVEPAEGTVVLDRTVFYPGGGGQPSDQGRLRAADGRTWQVRGAKKAGDDIVHQLEPGDGDLPAVGEPVTAELDWDRRFLLMRTHTALHTLCGVVWRDYGAQVTGGNMEPGSGRMDFEFERMSRRARRRDRGPGQRGARGRPGRSESRSSRARRRSRSRT